jgi:hypothetical protein
MQGYSKGSLGPFIPDHYNRLVQAYMQGDCKGIVGPFITVNYNG